MFRRFVVSGVSALALATVSPAFAQQAASEKSATPTMNFGTWGVDIEQVDPSIDPGTDFNAYVNSRWVAVNRIPDDRTRFGAFDMLNEEATRNVEGLVRELVASDPAAGTSERRIVNAYTAFMDTDAIERAGLEPAYPYLSEIFAAPDLDTLVGLFEQAGYPALVNAGVSIDLRDPDSHIVSIGFSGMGLPDRDYYLVDSERNLEIRAAYEEYLAFMLEQAGYADPAFAAKQVYDFEHKVAQLEWDRSLMRNPQLTYNLVSRDELSALAPSFPVQALLESGDFADQERFQIAQIPPADEEAQSLGLTDSQRAMMGGGLPAMMQLLTETPLANLKAWMAVRFLSAHSAVLPKVIDDADFAFYSGVLNGQPEQEARWKRGIAAVESQLGEQLGALYVARYFPPTAKAQMDELVANLRRAQGQALDSNAWMTPATIAEARAKLDAFTPMIGYPDEFEIYDGLVISHDDPLGNRIRATQWAMDDAHARLGGPVDKTEWGMLPQTVNAYYSPVFNQIVFPAAILQAPFFDPEADPAVNYGGIGAVIGHEIGHGFDDSGSQYDGTGALRNWWTDEDRAGFTAEIAKLAEQIDAWCPLDDGKLCMKSGLAMGETLGDVVGLQMAYRAYRLSLDGKEPPVIDGLSGDQRFFLGYAQVWRNMIRPERLRSQIMTDPHPPADFRVNNTVRNVDAWYIAFDVKPGDPLYLAPEDRVSIW